MKISKFAPALAAIIVILTTASPAQADTFRKMQWHLDALNIAKANQISKGRGVTVAVVDTGVNTHPDLSRNLLAGTSVTAKTDDKGRIDRQGHGTQMASLIAAHGRGSSGVVGIAPSAKILPVRNTKADGGANSVDVADAFDWSTAHGATIISFSAGASPTTILNKAVTAAEADDVLIVASAGNKGQSAVASYPAAYSGVLSVGASDRSGKPAELTVPGPNVQICAPGVDIAGAGLENRYMQSSGTSPAAAIAAGAAALVRAKFPDISAPEVIHRLTATADDIGAPGRDDTCGYGILNVVRALTADVPPLAEGAIAAPSTSATDNLPSVPRSYPKAASTESKDAGTSVFAIAGGVFGVLALAGLAGFVVLRRRRT